MNINPVLLYKFLVVGVIVIFIGVGIQPAIADNDENFDLELVNIRRDIAWWQEVSRGPWQYEKEFEIAIRNNGPGDYRGKIKISKEIIYLGLRNTYVRSEEFYVYLKSGVEYYFKEFDEWGYSFERFPLGLCKVSYSVYPTEDIDKEVNIDNNVKCKWFLCLYFKCYPNIGWL